MRTYGKRPRVKSSDGQASKRRKFSEDPVIRTPEKDANTDTDVEFVEESSTPVKSKTYRTPSGTPSKLVRDLSGIFDTMSPSGIRSPATSTTPTKLAKRMLGRSKTESSVESQSPSVKEQQAKGLDRTSSLPIFRPSSSSAQHTPHRLSSSDNNNSILSLSRPTIFSTAASASKGSTTRTYAGKYRSFLMALPASSSGSTPLSQGLTNEDEFETRESYSSLRSRWGVDNSEDDPHPSYNISSPSNSTTTASEASPSRSNGKGKAAIRTVPIPNGMMNPLKSISELRNKGEIRRFLDEVGYLFEGLDPKCGIALRRSSALEITTKLCDPEFTRKAKAADFFGKTWELFLLTGAGKGEDKILDILLVFFLALVARDPVSLAELAERPTNDITPSESHHERGQDTSLVDILIRILKTISSKDDLLAISDQSSRPGKGKDVKRPAIPKKDRTILHSIVEVITSKSNLFPPHTPISIPLLITLTLQTLPPSCLSVSCLPTLLDSLRHCLSPHPDSDTDTDASTSTTTLYTAISSEYSWLNVAKSVPYESVYHHLKLVDAYLVGLWIAMADPDREKQQVEGHRFLDKARDEWMVRDLLALGVCCELKLKEGENEEEEGDGIKVDGAHQKCFTLTLRVLISLTHNDKEWARGVMGCGMTMGLILRTVWKVGRQLLSLARDEDVSEDEDDEEEEGEGEEGDVDSKPANENERDGGFHAFDTLCLVLGLLTNLVQVVDDAKNVVRKSHLDPSCTLRNRACLKLCTCAQKPRKAKEHAEEEERRGGIQVLVWLYEQLQTQQKSRRHESVRVGLGLGEFQQQQQQQQQQENEAQFSFLSGNLSVLFGLLMMGRSGVENRGVILGSNDAAALVSLPLPLPCTTSSQRKRHRHRKRDGQGQGQGQGQGESQRRKDDASENEDHTHNDLTTTRRRLELVTLASQAREFGAFYSVVSRRMSRVTIHGHGEGEGEGEGEEGQGQGGSKVVQRVVEFLEGLIDR